MVSQILAVTCNNASNNNTMIEGLAHLLEEFPGQANHARCFAHISNLTVKSVLRQFDVPQVKGDEAITVQENENPSGEEKVDEENGDDNVDGWADERLGMSEVELEELEEEIKPVRLMLTKVS